MVDQGNLRIGRYNSCEFPYVIVSSQRVPRKVLREHGSAFGFTSNVTYDESYVMELEGWLGRNRTYNKICKEGKHLIFVVGDLVPEKLQDIPVVHEFVEGYFRTFLRDRDLCHSLGVKAEFEEAQKRGNGFLFRYTRFWIDSRRKKLDALSPLESNALKYLLPQEALPIFKEMGYIL